MICPRCNRKYKIGKTGITVGCDKCFHIKRGRNGQAIFQERDLHCTKCYEQRNHIYFGTYRNAHGDPEVRYQCEKCKRVRAV